MRIAALNALPFRLPLRAPLRLVGGIATERCGVIVEVVGEDGTSGIGETGLSPDATADAANELARRLLALRLRDTSSAVNCAALPPALHRAVETALLDLEARRAGKRLADQLGGARRAAVLLNAMIGRDTAAATARAAAAARARGYACVKIKIDPRDAAGGEAVLRAARAAVGDDIALRADLNGGWDVEQAATFLARIEDLRLEYVEQPVATLAELRHLRARVATPLAADEAIDGAAAVRVAAQTKAADVVVIKPARLGLRASLEAIQAARDGGLDVVISSNLDSGVGIAAALHLAALLPDPARPCGLATVDLWTRDLVRPSLLPRRGSLLLPSGPGLGVDLDREALAALRLDTQRQCATG